MQTVLQLVERAGGYRPTLWLKIDNPPYLPLVIEAIGTGPSGLPALSVAHYGEQNGDLMRDPEMCFELVPGENPNLNPYYWRNDYVAFEEWSRESVNDCYYEMLGVHEEHRQFATTWDRNLQEQGFLEAFTQKSIRS